MTSLEGWDTTNMPTLLILVRLVGLEPTWLTPTDFKSVVYTDSTTVAKNGRTERIRTSDPLLPKQMHYQAVLLSDFYILIQLGNKVNWWDYLDLNQESTNYEFAALTNYAIV